MGMKTLLHRWHRLRRRVLLHRRLLAALLAGVAVLLGVEAAAEEPPPTQSVWSAARDLPSGTRLQPSDFRRTGFATGTAPDEAVDDPARVSGRTLAVPLHRGEPLTTGKVVGAGLLAGHPGRVAVPVRITDPAVAALRKVGDRVDLVAVGPPGGAREGVPGVEVLALPRPTEDGFGAGVPGRLVVVAAAEQVSDTLSALGVSYFVTVLWRD
jgi:Flp pilus assembly protein CpaB